MLNVFCQTLSFSTFRLILIVPSHLTQKHENMALVFYFAHAPILLQDIKSQANKVCNNITEKFSLVNCSTGKNKEESSYKYRSENA